MNSISQYLEDDHRRCDAHFAAAEAALMEQDWAAASGHFHGFRSALTRHIGIEEEILFPALEPFLGSTMGPTQVMRMEHRQMEQLFQALENAIDGKNQTTALTLAANLQNLLRQHNIKEEQILYPMADQTLSQDMVAHMASFNTVAAS